MWNTPTAITSSTTSTFSVTTNVSKRAALRMPWVSSQAISRHSTAANRSTRCPCPVPGAPSIQAGRFAPISSTRKPKYPEMPMATTATIAVYSSSRSQPMNQPANSPSTA